MCVRWVYSSLRSNVASGSRGFGAGAGGSLCSLLGGMGIPFHMCPFGCCLFEEGPFKVETTEVVCFVFALFLRGCCC